MALLKIPVGPDDHVQGDAHAPITLVEYGDYECPHCGHAYGIIQEVQKFFGKRLKFIFRNFPLKQVHQYAEIAAETAEFAASKGQFWPMHDLIFENQERLDADLLLELATELTLPEQEFRNALTKHDYARKVQDDFRGGVRSGVNGTPTFFINGVRHDRAFEIEDLIAAIEDALSQTAATP